MMSAIFRSRVIILIGMLVLYQIVFIGALLLYEATYDISIEQSHRAENEAATGVQPIRISAHLYYKQALH